MFPKDSIKRVVVKNVLIIFVIISTLILIVKFSPAASDDIKTDTSLLTEETKLAEKQLEIFDIQIPSQEFIDLLIYEGYFTKEDIDSIINKANESSRLFKDLSIETGKITEEDWNKLEEIINSQDGEKGGVDLVVYKSVKLSSGEIDNIYNDPSDLKLSTNKPIIFSAVINNQGNLAVDKEFKNIFQVSFSDDFSDSKKYDGSIINSIEAGGSGHIDSEEIKLDYGKYYIRSCADMNIDGNGVIDEIDENNNCGEFISFEITSSTTEEVVNSRDNPQFVIAPPDEDPVEDIITSPGDTDLSDGESDIDTGESDNTDVVVVNHTSRNNHTNNKDDDEEEKTEEIQEDIAVEEINTPTENNVLKNTQINKPRRNIDTITYNVLNLKTDDIINAASSDSGKIITNSVSSAGILSGTSISASAILSMDTFMVSDFFLGLVRVWGIALTALGIRKRNKYWGSVYDSVTKRPLDPAYVTLKDMNDKPISSIITDIDGRYGFLAQKGKYKIEVHKTNYDFPSKKIVGKSVDQIYSDLYFGDIIEISQDGEVISKNIPMDPVGFDWNEFEKNRINLTKFYSKRNIILNKIADILFPLGLIITIINMFITQSLYNVIVLFVYIFLYALKFVVFKPKSYSSVLNKTDNTPLSFSIVHIVDKLSHQTIHKVTDKVGRFYCILPNGKYEVIIEKKNTDDNYTEVYRNENYEVKNGKISDTFKI